MDQLDFAAVYRRYAPDVYRFALYLSGNFALAEDLTAETFARAWTARDRIRVGTVKAYLLMIARNLHLDERRRRTEVNLPEDLDVADATAGPEAATHARHQLRRVLTALGELTDADREVLALATIEGLSHHTIAQALGISVDAVKVRVHRARVRLNTALDQMEADHVRHQADHS